MMSDSESQFLATFNELVQQCETLAFITRDSALQREACRLLERHRLMIADEKKQAVTVGAEDYANTLLGCECVATALIAQLQMWLLLKADRPDDAWNELVNAQQGLRDATRAHRGFEHVTSHLEQLSVIEKLVFPPQVFLSAGMIVESQICTICRNDYEKCEHIKGRAYMGEFCSVMIMPSEVDHVAVVDNPASKRCRITSFAVNGGRRNRMTWKIKTHDDETGDTESSEVRKAQAIIATSSTFTEG